MQSPEIAEQPESSEIKPANLIPEFNALGNHPADMLEYTGQHLRGTLERLNKLDCYPQTMRIVGSAIRELEKEGSSDFKGHHVPNGATGPMFQLLTDTFVNLEQCRVFGEENLAEAYRLIHEGNNVLIVQNHTSPMDALVPLALIKERYGRLPVSVVTSQVFEYARTTRLMTSGVDKYPVFQPKHIKRFEGNKLVVAEMCRQNTKTLRTMVADAKEGGKMIFLYPEKNRNSDVIGIAEPGAMAVPELLTQAGKELYVLPTFITGVDSIFPNHSGRNEMDDFFEIIQRGQGDLYCGQPIKYSDIVSAAESIPTDDQARLEEKIVGVISGNKKITRKSLISGILLGEIARLSPDKEKRGVFGDQDIQELVENVG